MYNVLGSTGIKLSKIALGTATFGVAPEEQDAVELVEYAIDSGINYIDTANSYGNQPRFDREGKPGWSDRRSSEEIVGEALSNSKRRDDVILATKVSEPVGDGPNDGGLSSVHILRSIERSLERLQTSYVDIYYAHHPDPLTNIEITLRTFADLISQGWIRHYALSTYDGWQVADVVATAERLGLPKPVCHQTRYSLAKRWVESEVLPATRSAGIDVAAFSPLAGGLLANPKDDFLQSGDARWGGSPFNGDELKLRDRFLALAKEWEMSPAQLALAWLLHQPAISSVIVGPENIAELSELIPAADIELMPDQIDSLNQISPSPPNLWTQ